MAWERRQPLASRSSDVLRGVTRVAYQRALRCDSDFIGKMPMPRSPGRPLKRTGFLLAECVLCHVFVWSIAEA